MLSLSTLPLIGLLCLAASVSGDKPDLPVGICARVHNNTALDGALPFAIIVSQASGCQKTCVDMFPECRSVVYYYVKNDTSHHYCYLFMENSVSDNVTLVEQKPVGKKDVVRMLELVEHCREFDAFPPIHSEEGLATSSDRVDRKKRHDGSDDLEAGDWTDWGPCTDLNHTTRSRECQYGRKIERRGCPARQYQRQQQAARYPYPAQPQPPQPPRPPQQAQPSPADIYAQEYHARMVNYRPRVRHPAIPAPVPCTGPNCPIPAHLFATPQTQPVPPPQEHAAAPTRYRPAPPPPPACNSPGCIATPAPRGVWHEWSEWSQCSCTCGDGTRQRRRECSGNNCEGPAFEEGRCSMGPCSSSAWSEWCEWSACRGECGRGDRIRTRYCTLGTQRCTGSDYESEACEPVGCSVQWATWQEWSACSATCGQGGRRSRMRTCPGPTGNECQGPRQEDGHCEPLPSCSLWGDWSDWGLCSVSCGQGSKRRTRVCQGGHDCQGAPEETTYCMEATCAAWTHWQDWSRCSQTCGQGGRRTRTRICQGGVSGTECPGPHTEDGHCEPFPSCSQWADWAEWGQCSVSCGQGSKRRTRVCVGGDDCQGAPEVTTYCEQPSCASWTHWEEWSRCSQTCGQGGRRTRTRICQGGMHGNECPGNGVEDGHCEPLPQCSFWGEWAEWGQCSTTCGRGSRRRTRVCEGGHDCQGTPEEISYCEQPACAMWTDWCEWSLCSTTCGTGQRERTRECLTTDNERSNACEGQPMETSLCVGTDCCQWSVWCDWSDCSHQCGGGRMERSRVCERPDGGLLGNCRCDGSDVEVRECNAHPCQLTCAWTDWCPWSDCTTKLECEVGISRRSRQCVGQQGCECLGLAEEEIQCRGREPCKPNVPC